MPELPEVETVRRGLNLVTLGKEIQGGEILLERTIAYPATASEFLQNLTGSAIAQWHRRGKYLLAELISPNPLPPCPPAAGHLGIHLRMTGQLLWVDPTEPLQKHTRIRFFFETGKELRFVDQRTFGQMWWVPSERAIAEVITGLQFLGPEPFSDEFSVAYLQDRLQHRRRPVKNALLDQAIVAGIGNIYADEALFLSGIQPQHLCTNLNLPQITLLHSNIRKVLQDSIEANGTSFSTFRNVAGVNGNYGGIAWVYGRDGHPCRTCGTVIERLKLAGRSAHFCPNCQH